MTYLAEKLEHLNAETGRLKAMAKEIADAPEPTARQWRSFEEYLSLIDEINDYAERLQRPGEKWREPVTRCW